MTTQKKLRTSREPKFKACEYCPGKIPIGFTKCPHCLRWNLDGVVPSSDPNNDQTILLKDVTGEDDARHIIGIEPFDELFGGSGEIPSPKGRGLVHTSVTLWGGGPGAGKSTGSLQLCAKLVELTNGEVLYVSAEEASLSVKSRAFRIGVSLEGIRLHPMGSTADLSSILMNRKPRAAVFDSHTAFISDPEEGVDFCEALKGYAIALSCPMIVLCQVTKSDDFAGLKKLQHVVDTLITLYAVEDTRDEGMREFYVEKNRFGKANFVRRVRMTEKWGLVYREQDQEDDPGVDPDGDEDSI